MATASGLPDGVEPASLEEIACRVARAAGRLVVEERPDHLGVVSKSSATDPVTVMDQRSQELIVELLATARPHDAVLGEEEGGSSGTSGLTWVIDPIDGTVNYLYGIPSYAVSVAVVTGDPTRPGEWSSVAGAVLNPETGELFHAHVGGGARLTTDAGTRTLRATAATDVAHALVGTGFGYTAALRRRQAALLVDLLPQVRDIRRHGGAALDLCGLAVGRLDAYYESALNPWDRAAGELVAREAGAVLGGPVGDVLTRDLVWGAAPGLAAQFGPLVRDLSARHVGSVD